MAQFVHPASPADVTPQWLSRALREAGRLASGEVTACHAEIIGEGRGFTGVIARLSLAYERASGAPPASLIAKFPLADRPVDSSYRRAQPAAASKSRQMVERAAQEIAFYQTAGQHLPQLPRCYFGHADVDAREAVLLLEDLSAGVPGDALAGCSVHQAHSVLAAIRDVHARWWRDVASSRLPWLTDWSATSNRRVMRYREQVEPVIAAYGDRFPSTVVDLMRALVEPYERILAGLAAVPETLIHADLHLDNVMFVPGAGGFEAKLIDWQSPSRGAAMLDVAGFMAESLTIDDRRAHELELLREYHGGLLAVGVRDYSFEQLFGDYRRALCVRMVGQVGWLARVIEDEPKGRERELLEALLDPGTVFVAVRDHDAIGRDPLT